MGIKKLFNTSCTICRKALTFFHKQKYYIKSILKSEHWSISAKSKLNSSTFLKNHFVLQFRILKIEYFFLAEIQIDPDKLNFKLMFNTEKIFDVKASVRFRNILQPNWNDYSQEVSKSETFFSKRRIEFLKLFEQFRCCLSSDHTFRAKLLLNDFGFFLIRSNILNYS